MPATLLVLDIDGTLRPHGEPRVPKENVDALRTVQKAGVKLVIATGRCRAEIPAKMLRGIPAGLLDLRRRCPGGGCRRDRPVHQPHDRRGNVRSGGFLRGL